MVGWAPPVPAAVRPAWVHTPRNSSAAAAMAASPTPVSYTHLPSGFTRRAVEAAEGIAQGLGYATRRTNKGGLVIEAPGREHTKKVGLCAHIDTLG